MSRTPHSDEEASSPQAAQDVRHLTDAMGQLARMLRQGRSFSGHERNCCFLNTSTSVPAAGRFANVSAISGLDFLDDGRAVCVVDWDRDGDLDIWFANRSAPQLRLMRNDTPAGRHFLALQLEGDGSTTNRDAIGARVEVVTDFESSLKLAETLRAGEGFLAQSSKWLHFGLGHAQRIEYVIVHWPGGSAEEFAGLQVDGSYLLVQGRSTPVEVPRRSEELALSPAPMRAASLVEGDAIRLPYPFEIPAVPLRGFEGASVNHQFSKPTLIMLWSTDCSVCLAEMKELAERQQELEAAGIDVLALCIDGVATNNYDPQRVNSLLGRLHYPFAAAWASEKTVEAFQILHDRVTGTERALPVPTSFLLAEGSRLSVIYEGSLPVEELLEDAAWQPGSTSQRIERAAILPGSVLDHPLTISQFQSTQAHFSMNVARLFQNVGLPQQAISNLRQAVELRPYSALLQVELGMLLSQEGDEDTALQHFDKALELDPEFTPAYCAAGTLYLEMPDLDRAQQFFEEAIRLEPDNLTAHIGLGNVSLMRGLYDEAFAKYTYAVQLNDENADVHYNLALVLVTRNEHATAREHLETAVQIAETENRPDLVAQCRELLAQLHLQSD